MAIPTHLKDDDPVLEAIAAGVEIGHSAIRAAREFRGLSVEELGLQVGTTAMTIKHIEDGGAPDRVLLDALAEALQVPSGVLAG